MRIQNEKTWQKNITKSKNVTGIKNTSKKITQKHKTKSTIWRNSLTEQRAFKTRQIKKKNEPPERHKHYCM